MSTHTKALLAILLAAILWASATSVAKILFLEASPFVVATHRFFLASLLILPFFLHAKKPKGYVWKLLPLGILNTGNILFYYSGLSLTTANTAIILGTTVPLITAILSPLFIREHIGANKLLGISIGLCGALFLVLYPLFSKGTVATGNLLGNLLLIGSLLSWSLYIIYSRFVLSKGSYSPILSTSVNIFVVTIASILASLLTSQTLISPALYHISYVGILFYASIGITIVPYFLFQWGVQHVSASTSSLKEYVQLVIGMGLNMVILGEHLTGVYLFGSALILCGIFVATSQHVSRKLAAILFSQGE